uniref:Glycoprotein n=1 Tax=Blattodean rhabdo-related virus OKIAV14 TaxID=2746364 RepID=A0A7D7F8N2_9RHAB|nr:glycoprotein [Blattodean rhabdo-related virus OKIAV14]
MFMLDLEKPRRSHISPRTKEDSDSCSSIPHLKNLDLIMHEQMILLFISVLLSASIADSNMNNKKMIILAPEFANKTIRGYFKRFDNHDPNRYSRHAIPPIPECEFPLHKNQLSIPLHISLWKPDLAARTTVGVVQQWTKEITSCTVYFFGAQESYSLSRVHEPSSTLPEPMTKDEISKQSLHTEVVPDRTERFSCSWTGTTKKELRYWMKTKVEVKFTPDGSVVSPKPTQVCNIYNSSRCLLGGGSVLDLGEPYITPLCPFKISRVAPGFLTIKKDTPYNKMGQITIPQLKLSFRFDFVTAFFYCPHSTNPSPFIHTLDGYLLTASSPVNDVTLNASAAAISPSMLERDLSDKKSTNPYHYSTLSTTSKPPATRALIEALSFISLASNTTNGAFFSSGSNPTQVWAKDSGSAHEIVNVMDILHGLQSSLSRSEYEWGLQTLAETQTQDLTAISHEICNDRRYEWLVARTLLLSSPQLMASLILNEPVSYARLIGTHILIPNPGLETEIKILDPLECYGSLCLVSTLKGEYWLESGTWNLYSDAPPHLTKATTSSFLLPINPGHWVDIISKEEVKTLPTLTRPSSNYEVLLTFTNTPLLSLSDMMDFSLSWEPVAPFHKPSLIEKGDPKYIAPTFSKVFQPIVSWWNDLSSGLKDTVLTGFLILTFTVLAIKILPKCIPRLRSRKGKEELRPY